MLKCYSMQKKVDKMMKLLEDMKEAKVEQTVVTHWWASFILLFYAISIILNGLGENGDIPGMLKYFSELLETGGLSCSYFNQVLAVLR